MLPYLIIVLGGVYMKITYPQYIENPMQNRVMTNRNMYRQHYTSILEKLIVREHGEIPFFLFKDNPGRYIALIRVPSESVKSFFYDVAIEFTSDSDAIIGSNTLKDYNVRFYANDPAFMYTFCYSFIQNDLFFKDLESKMSKMAKEQSASITNAKNEVGYCKSLYFAYLIMEYRHLFNKSEWGGAKKYDKHILLGMVEHTKSKHLTRQQMEVDQRQQAKKYDKAKPANPLEAKRTGTNERTKQTISTKFADSVKRVKAAKRL